MSCAATCPSGPTRSGRGAAPGARRAGLVTAAGAARQQVRDLLEVAWPAVLDAAAQPLDSASWLAAVTVALDRIGTTGELGVLGRAGWDDFAPRSAPSWATRWYSSIVRAVFDAATDPAHATVGVTGQRAGALERVAFALADLAARRAEIDQVDVRILSVLDALDLTELVTTIPDCPRSAPRRSWPRPATYPVQLRPGAGPHAGLCPRDNASGTYQGKTAISGRGRPELRLAAWRAVFGALRHNRVLAARHAHLTGRADNPLTDTQARVAVAASLLRQLHAIVVTRTAWDPAVAAGLDRREDGSRHRRLSTRAADHRAGRAPSPSGPRSRN